MADLVEYLSILSIEIDFVTQLRCTDRKWGRCIVTKV